MNPPDQTDLDRRAAAFVHERRGTFLRLVDSAGAAVDLSPGAIAEIDRALAARAGEDRLISTSEAAEILGVSRPTVVRYLEAGELAHVRPGSHRRLRLSDVLAFRDRHRVIHETLAEMTREAVDAGLYDLTAEDYREMQAGLREVRHQLAREGDSE